MNGFIDILKDWHLWVIVGGYWVVMAAIGGMPEPNSASSLRYRWAYRSSHIFAANVKTAFAAITDKK
jgi:hypothetical protein